jgi:hypothetical protein
MRYVRRDSELAMLLAQYNNCFALRIIKIFMGYAKMGYYLTVALLLGNTYHIKEDKTFNHNQSEDKEEGVRRDHH